MSSICGSFGRVSASLSPMLEAMRSRGPDAQSIRADRDRGVALGLGQFKTLRDEPDSEVLVSEDGNLLMVCDAQVFNAQDLASELRGRGHDIRSSQSGEVLLHLFEEQGADGFRRADGQFALAIWD